MKFLQALFPTDASFAGRPLMERISYHYITRRNIQRRWDKTETARKKKLIEFPLEYGGTYEIKRIFTKVTVI
jgi:hypothetical protein